MISDHEDRSQAFWWPLAGFVLAALASVVLATSARGETEETTEAAPPFLLGALQLATAQPASPDQEPSLQRTQAFEERALRPGRYLGVASCASPNCHGSAEAREANVLLNEYLTWLDDPHSQTYNTLFNEDSELIKNNLGLDEPAYEQQQCLECHTMVVPRRLQEQPIDLEEGVGCEACHGPSSGWIGEHVEADWKHRDSLRRGMVDLRRISGRATVCLRCHQGRAEQSVDHELLAAGHPRLLFELDNFTGSLPPHWLNRANRHGAAAWATGQIVTFREGLAQLEDRAKSGRWPEFTEMKCESCHHTLEEERWRQGSPTREPGTTRGGLPPWSPHRWAVIRHLVSRVDAARNERLDTMIAELAASVARMNDPETTARTAAAISTELEPVLEAVEQIRWTSAETRQVLRRIAADRNRLVSGGIQSVEQASLAMNSLISHLASQDRTVLDGPMPALLEQLDLELASRFRFDGTRVADLIERLGEHF